MSSVTEAASVEFVINMFTTACGLFCSCDPTLLPISRYTDYDQLWADQATMCRESEHEQQMLGSSRVRGLRDYRWMTCGWSQRGVHRTFSQFPTLPSKTQAEHGRDRGEAEVGTICPEGLVLSFEGRFCYRRGP